MLCLSRIPFSEEGCFHYNDSLGDRIKMDRLGEMKCLELAAEHQHVHGGIVLRFRLCKTTTAGAGVALIGCLVIKDNDCNVPSTFKTFSPLTNDRCLPGAER